MARLARFVVPGILHHDTQRGIGRQRTCHGDEDYAAYRDLLATHCAAHGVAVSTWALMPNHVHPILVPESAAVCAPRCAMSRSNRCARLTRRGADWPRSSVHALLDRGRGDALTDTAPVLKRVPDLAALLRPGEDEAMSALLRRSENTGRPRAGRGFLDRVEAILGRDPSPEKRGPKVKGN